LKSQLTRAPRARDFPGVPAAAVATSHLPRPHLIFFLFHCSFFAADLSGAPGNVSFVGYSHSGDFFYNLTSSDVDPADVTATWLVDGNPSRNLIEVVELDGVVAPDSTDFATAESYPNPDPPVYAYFTRDDIVETRLIEGGALGGVYDLLQHVCMGHIFVMVNTTEGLLYAPLAYQPPTSSTNGPIKSCEEAAQPYRPAVAAAPGAAPASASTRPVAVAAFWVAAALVSMLL
jgi:hypothetical protein